MNRLVKERHTDKTCKEKYMNIVYAFIIIDLICVRCLETLKHSGKYLIHRSIMYCFVYYESKLFIVYMIIVYAFIIIDVICVRCMETEKVYCKYIQE